MAYKVPVQQGPSFVDDVLKNVDTLPQTLRNVYGQIKDLDVQLKQIEEEANESLGSAAEGATLADHEAAQEKLRKSADAVHANCAELADKKIALAQNASDIIATVIRGIDDKLLRFENQLRKEGRWPADAPPTKLPKTLARTLPVAEVNANAPKKANVLVHPPQSMRSSGSGLADDAIVDPNEPRYCSCRQVSFGEMIACENAEVGFRAQKTTTTRT
uniref:Inhibitor of growth protein N-terminal histone-binding domain-containing protein n=1 Tax=Rhodosorus marinus TaxID=101924 RepID=A0A7S0BHS8_9RHOD|mmetsp:Transcript_15788/g.23100  ORF Transcript_15788/g.23100 Transcript_15788/m.23100 type:complete len:217 (+) Transcript_15788:106-756(+)